MSNFVRLILATFLSTLGYTIGIPTENLYVFKGLTQSTLATSSIIVCFGGVIAALLWNRWSDKFYPYWGVLCYLEIFGVFSSIVYLLISEDKQGYFLISSGINALVVRNMVCGGNKLRVKLFQGEEREHYDNWTTISMCSATIIGGIVNIVWTVPLIWALGSICVGATIDNILYWGVWKQTLQIQEK